MGKFQINISDVIKLIRLNGMSSEDRPFSIKYRKSDGSYGFKKGVRRRAGKAHLNKENETVERTVQKIESDGSKFHLIAENGQRFEVFICMVTHFNNQLIDHRF